MAADLGRLQHHVVATWQLDMLGFSKTAISQRVARHAWVRRHRGVLAMPGPDEPIRDLAAAVLAFSRPAGAAGRVEELRVNGYGMVEALAEAALGCGQVVCGPSALWLYGLDAWPGSPWLRLPRGCGNATRAAVRIRHGDPTGGCRRMRGVPAVDLEQALMDIPGCRRDLTGRALHHYLAKIISSADARRMIDVDHLGARVAEAAPFLGVTALEAVVEDLRGQLSHSATEKKARTLVNEVAAALGLSVFPRPFEVRHDGRRIAEADLAIIEIRLDIEVDGPHHLLPSQLKSDQRRDRSLRRAGWEVERFPTELVDLQPKVFAARVREAIEFRIRALQATPTTVGPP